VARTEFPAKATHAQTRAHNAALVLRALYDLGPISRADIARLTGLTRTSVGELVSDLEKDGLAIGVGLGPSTGGKQPTLVALNANARTIITLDLGERTFTAALANLRGGIEACTRREP
jgi:DNA-binding Lrp family transcriptional regulator